MNTFVQQIENGDHDGDLAVLKAAVRDRVRYLGSQNRQAIQVGDVVVFNDTVSPKYLRGVKATVVGVGAKVRVNVADDPMARRYRRAQNVRCVWTIIDSLATAGYRDV